MSARPETDEELRTRIANAYGKWGAFLTEVIESSGKALEECAKHVGLKRETVDDDIGCKCGNCWICSGGSL